MSTKGSSQQLRTRRPLGNRTVQRYAGTDRHGFAVSQGFDIAHWWLAEETVKAEPDYALVADFARRARGINPVNKHRLPWQLPPVPIYLET
jgi:hypothetical protein